MNTYGTVESQSGTLRFEQGMSLEGLFVTGAGAGIQFNGGTYNYLPTTRLTGTGMYYLTGGTLNGLDNYLPNLSMSGGTVNLSPVYQTNGVIVRLDLSGAALGGSNAVAGVLNMGNGAVNGPLALLAGSVMNFSGNAKLYGSVVVRSNAVLNWSGNGQSYIHSGTALWPGGSLLVESNGLVNFVGSGSVFGGSVTNYGRVVQKGGWIYLWNDGSSWWAKIENLGVWELQGDWDTYQYYNNDNAYFRNYGLLRKAVGTGTASINVPYYNQGNIEQTSGSLNFGRNFSLTDGTVTFGLGASGYGQINVSGTATLAGRLGVTLLDGFIPASNAVYTVMTHGVRANTFTNYDGLNTGFGRYLTPSYSASALTLTVGVTNRGNTVPGWTTIPNYTIVEGRSFAFTNVVSDAQGDTVLYKLLAGPAGATVGLSNGVFNWTPSEAQGQSTNTVGLYILDGGSPSLMATQYFTILVTESNAAPVLPVIANQVMGIKSPLTLYDVAVDSDIPTNTLVYTLLTAPSGMTQTNGVISWLPTVPGTFQVTMKVVDNGSPALAATNSFTVRVLDEPTPPQGLVSWWTGDDTTEDKMGYHNGVLTGSAGYAAGYYGSRAFNFQGGWMIVSNSPLLSFPPGNAMTVDMWVKRTGGSYPVYFFGKQDGCGSYNYRSPSDWFSAGTPFDPPVNQWRHYAWVFTGQEMLLYADGVNVSRVITTLGPENLANLLIGASGTCGQSFYGLVDEVRLFKRALSADEVGRLYAGVNTGELYFTRHPRHQTAMIGGSAIFTTTVNGAQPLGYQWRFKGTPLAGQTTSNLTLNAVTLVNAGEYDVVVTNAVNTITSELATLTVRLHPVLPSVGPQLVGVDGLLTVNNAASSGAPAGGLAYSLLSAPSGMTIGTNGLITWTPTSAQAPATNAIITRVVDSQFPALSATNSFVVRVLTKPTVPSGLVSWWTGDNSTADQMGLNDGILSGAVSYAPGLYGQAFQFDGGWLSMLNTASLSFAPNARMSLEMWVKRSASGYPLNYFGKQVGCSDWNYQSMTERFSAGSDYDAPVGEWRHFLWVFTGTEMLGYVNGVMTHRLEATMGSPNNAPLFIGAAGNCGQPFRGLMDEVRIYNRALTSNEVASIYGGLSVTFPLITQDPVGQTIASGDPLTLTAGAIGASPLRWQWYRNGTPVTGLRSSNSATNSTLQLLNIQTADAGNYQVVVTNAYGSVTSQVAAVVVSIGTPPALSVQPASLTNVVGTTASFNVTATGTAPLYYQWLREGSPIAMATNSAYSIANLQSANSGTYWCVVTNIAGSVTSQVATLTVYVVPTITSQPQSQTKVEGTAAAFSVTASGTPAPAYQWRKNGGVLGGMTNSTYSIASVQMSHAGDYDVLVSNAAGSITSTVATLTVTIATVNPTNQFLLSSNYNLISIPLNDTGLTNAETVAQSVPNCTVVWKWDAALQQWYGHNKGTPLRNFAVTPGQSLLVSVSAAQTWTVTGSGWAAPVASLKAGYNLVMLPKGKESLTTAEQVAQNIPNCTVIWKWDSALQQWYGHNKGTPLRNFAVTPGQAYLISVSADGTW
jgi:hypothetical protein